MPQNNDPDNSSATATTNGAESPSPSKGTDFKLYLDAVNAASQRTRSILYVLVAMIVLTLSAYRNTSNPAWIEARLANLQLASACRKQGEPYPPNCDKAIAYAKKFVFSNRTDKLLEVQEFDDQLREQITAFIRLRTEALSLRLPFFGVVIDMNDLGMVTGLFLAFVLYVLYAGFRREVDNLDRSMTKALKGTLKQQKERSELLLMTQVLASRKGVTFGVHILLLTVILVHGVVVYGDWETRDAAVTLQGPFRGTLETYIDVFLFGVVAILCVVCGLGQHKLDRKVDELITELTALEKAA
jgi:hypothetical protein